MHQLKLATYFGDPTIVARSKLYYSISLIQKGKLRAAKKTVREQYALAKADVEIDQRLIKMCLGIWMKLQYAYVQRHIARQACSDVISKSNK